MKQDLKKQTVFNFFILCPIFFVFSLLLSGWSQGREQDFGAYWQAGHMIAAGQNVYDTDQWIAVRLQEKTAFHSEPTFQYPLPLAVFFSLLAWLPVQTAYTVWLFLNQVAVLVSITILLGFYPDRPGYLALLAIAGAFFFRPMFSIVNSGQILPILLLAIALAIRLFHNRNWLWGGFALSILSLKPSVGFPVLVLAGLWLLFRKQWKGIGGMFIGGVVLVLIGMLVNPRWVLDYLSVGGDAFQKYFGMHPTVWGMIDRIVQIDSLTLIVGLICVAAIFGVEIYLFWSRKSNLEALPAFASIVPAALLVAPYSWHHDQVLLIVSIVFLLGIIAVKYGMGRSALLMGGIVAFAFAMLIVAYSVEHDAWSALNSLLVWLLSLYFVTKTHPAPVKEMTGQPGDEMAV
jgi:hypothetical protein